MDSSALTGVIGTIATAAAAIIIATSRRRDNRDKQWADMVAERNDADRRRDEAERRYDRLRRRYDELLDWAYKVRLAARRDGRELPELPEDIGE